MRLRLLVGFLLFALPISAFGESLLGLTTTNELVRFDSDTPGMFQGSPVPITGIVAGDTIVAIDRRPATGEIFALGVNGGGTTAHLYTIATTTGVATQVGGDIALPQAAGAATSPASGFGFDFNPVVDRIRVVTSGRDNFRLNPNTGAVTGADTILTPAGASIVGAAYTNNASSATSTTLYAIDTSTNPDQLVIIGGNPVPPGASPNGGVVTVVASLGVNTSSDEVGFEIAPSGTPFASLQVGGVSGLYTIDLTTGATLVGSFSGGTIIRDITTSSDAVTPIPALSPLAQALVVLVIVLSGLFFLRRRLSPAG